MDHSHDSENSFHETLEQTAMFAVAGIGIMANTLLFVLILIQRHTRNMCSSFILHACFLNTIQAAYCIPFGQGLQASKIPTSTCNSLGTSYIVFMTASVFNLVAMTCCEVYIFDNYCATQRKRPKGSLCCILFGVFFVYVGSIILHLGPTIIGGNFEENPNKRCLFVYDQKKNYIVYTMWILIVSIALASAIYYLAIFYRVINKTIEAKLIALSSRQDELQINMEEMDARMEQLSTLKHNRHRILAIISGIYFALWYPLYFLVLLDPKYKVTVELYKSLTIISFAKAAIEPFVFLIGDKQVNRLLMRVLPCTTTVSITTEDEVNKWLKVAEKDELDPVIEHPEMPPGCSNTSQTGSDSGIGSRLHNFNTVWRGSQDLEPRGMSSMSSPTRTYPRHALPAMYMYNTAHMTEV